MPLPLTHAHEDGVDTLAERTAQGQAYFAGSGPKRKTCRQCQYAEPQDPPRKANGMLKNISCRKYRELVGRTGKRFNPQLDACKYFAQAATPPKMRSF